MPAIPTKIGWMKISAAAAYMGVSVRTLRGYLKDGILPYSRMPSGLILLEKAAIDDALRNFTSRPRGDNVVDEIMSNLEVRQ